MVSKEDLFTEIFDKLKEIDEIIEEHGLSSLTTDCAEEECELTDDDDIIRTHRLLQEAFQFLDEYE